MVFMSVILQTTSGTRKAHEICLRITRHLDFRDIVQHTSVCADIATESGLHPNRTTRDNKDTEARNFNSKVATGKIQATVREIRGQC